MRERARFIRFAAAAALFAAAPALAHPGHGVDAGGALAGLLHPLSGIDHLVAMLGVGVWAAQLRGRATWLLPFAFVGVMAIAAMLAMAGHAPPAVETGVATSVFVLGLAIAIARRLPLPLAVAMTAAFALYHGAAHGAELPEAAAARSYAMGFLLATASLHVAGLAIGVAWQRHTPWLAQGAGLAAAGIGVAMLCG